MKLKRPFACRLWVPLLALVGTATPIPLRADGTVPSGAQGDRFTCLPLIRSALTAPVGSDLEITPEVAKQIRDFEEDFFDCAQVRALPRNQLETCLRQARLVSLQLLGLVRDRLVGLLERKEDDALEPYYREFGVFLEPWDEDQKKALARSPILEPAHKLYSRILLERLAREIAQMPGSRWVSYLRLDVTFVGWGPEWSRDLGRDEPGGVDFPSRRIALQTQLHEPAAMKVFLFHELAHLADPRVGGGGPGFARLSFAEQYENELFAWEKTIEFMADQERMGIPAPDYFRFHVLPVIELMQQGSKNPPGTGLRLYIASIFASRRGVFSAPARTRPQPPLTPPGAGARAP